jgi:hypothetical protein
LFSPVIVFLAFDFFYRLLAVSLHEELKNTTEMFSKIKPPVTKCKAVLALPSDIRQLQETS